MEGPGEIVVVSAHHDAQEQRVDFVRSWVGDGDG